MAILLHLAGLTGSRSTTHAEPSSEDSSELLSEATESQTAETDEPAATEQETLPIAASAEITPEQIHFFENEIRPILAEHCWKCHGEEKQRGGLRLDSRTAILLGGDSGPAVELDYLDDSLLVEAINYESYMMPPDGELDAEKVAALTRWVEMGAPWPGAEDFVAPVRDEAGLTEEDRQWWSFQPRAQVEPPAVADPDHWCANEIDQFVLASLRANGLEPSPQASRRELIRRAYFDLLGLPPSPEEIAAFEADERPDAYELLVDRLLESPHYGERWGRHWLDLVRYAETNGYERDNPKPQVWRYRDYVIDAFNADKPYDRFVIEQLAGDELAESSDDALIATGYYRLGVWDDEPDDRRQAEFDGLADILATTGSTFLGLTVGCARCHDHKFDPISHEDYHSLLAFIRNVSYFDNAAHGRLSSGEEALVVSEVGNEPLPTHVLFRGDSGSPGDEVQPRYLPVLFATSDAATAALPASAPGASCGRRLSLAQWIVSADNPLTARVMANRLWHWHFGQGIVPTPSDFGHTGMLPSHPDLLDWLAGDLVAGEWRLKRMHRLIMTSSTYRQSSRITAESAPAEEVDPANRLLWRQNMRRLEAEAIRDSVLATCGDLNPQVGGPSFYPRLSPQVLATASRPAEVWHESSAEHQGRRSVYVIVKRTLRVPMMELFDQASPDLPVGNRVTTTIAPQALMLLNSQFMTDQSARFAQRLESEAGSDPVSQIHRAYQLALGREPTSAETGIALAYLERTALALAERAGEVPTAPDFPLPGWTTYGGDWSLGDETEVRVSSSHGAKAVWNQLELADGMVQCQVMLMEPRGDAGLLLRVSSPQEGTDQLTAYNINVRYNALRLGKHENSWQELASVPLELEVGRWHTLTVHIQGSRLQIFIGEEPNARIDYTDDSPLPAGMVGFRNFHLACAFRDLRIETADGEFVPDLSPPTGSTYSALSVEHRHAALTSLCRMIMNLNEFVYVD